MAASIFFWAKSNGVGQVIFLLSSTIWQYILFKFHFDKVYFMIWVFNNMYGVGAEVSNFHIKPKRGTCFCCFFIFPDKSTHLWRKIIFSVPFFILLRSPRLELCNAYFTRCSESNGVVASGQIIFDPNTVFCLGFSLCYVKM